MKHFRVNDKNYALFEYTPYFNRNTDSIPRPKNTKYDLGDVVYLKHTNAIGVVLGCIDNETGELRTDMDGMVAFEDLRPATKEDFDIKDVRFCERLKEEVFLENREDNTKIIGGITHLKANTFNYHEAKRITKKHPLGDVYTKGDFGYVANGYDWWKFPLNRFDFIRQNG